MGEHIHRWLAVFAFAIALTAFLGWRALGSAGVKVGPSTAVLPNPQLTQLMQYVRPLGDTASFLAVGRETIVLPRDPFARNTLPQPSQLSRGQPSGGSTSPSTSIQWRVTATMIAGARRAAVINDMLIYVGDSVPGGGKLTSVEHDRVVVIDPKGTSHVVAVTEGETDGG